MAHSHELGRPRKASGDITPPGAEIAAAEAAADQAHVVVERQPAHEHVRRRCLLAWPIARTFASRLSCVSTTPFGSPVLPEVYCIRLSASGSSAAAAAVVRSAESSRRSRRLPASRPARAAAPRARGLRYRDQNRAPALLRMPIWRRMCSSSAPSAPADRSAPARRRRRECRRTRRKTPSRSAASWRCGRPARCRG